MSESNDAFVASAAAVMLKRHIAAKEQEAKRTAKREQMQRESQLPIDDFKALIVSTAMSYRDADEAAGVAKRTNSELASIRDRATLVHILQAERVKQLTRMKERGFKAPRKQHRNRDLTAELILRRKFGPLTPQYQFYYDAEIHSPILSKENGKYICKCDCGRLVYKHKHHLLRTIDEPGRAIRTCGKECGLNNDRTAKPVAVQYDAQNDAQPANSQLPNDSKPVDGLPPIRVIPPILPVESENAKPVAAQYAKRGGADIDTSVRRPLESRNPMKEAFAGIAAKRAC